MKNLIYVFVFGLLIISCATTKTKNYDSTSADTSMDTIRIANDSLEYEIMIIEPGFNSWLATQRPRGFYGITYLENKNRFYVTEYNQRVLQPFRYDPNLYLQQINYNPTTHYGYEVNYLLFNYFLYFEQRYRQRFIVSRGNRY